MEQAELIYQLMSFLLARGYDPGEKIPSERELGLRFGVSRTQVREALTALSAVRIVQRRAKSGLYMTEELPSIEALSLFAQVGIPLTPDDVRQIVEMRRIHEVEAVKLACARRTTADIARMREVLAATESSIDDANAVAERDREFHAAIVRATHNDIFLRIVNIFYLMTAERRAFYFRDPERRTGSLAQHHEIFEAIVASNAPRAVSLIESHLTGVDSYWSTFIAETGAAGSGTASGDTEIGSEPEAGEPT
ncbi:MAG TPA: FadR/GntR family transcriptional regulator [Trebonia sp.]|jgi:DNA-binding FadR family transcriptional regulator